MTTESVQKKDERYTDIVPFGAGEKDVIRLSIDIIKNMVAVKTKTGRTCSDIDAMKFIAMCKARRLNPFEGDAYLIGYDGTHGPTFSLITAHQAFLKRAELNPEYDGMKSGIIIRRDGNIVDVEGDFCLPGDELLGGWATVFFKKRQYPMNKRVRLTRFQKPFGIWQDDPAGMICKCAEADALRSSFPTMLGGLYLKEELERVSDDPKVTTPIFTTPVAAEPVVTVEEPKAPEPVNLASAKPKPAPEPFRPKTAPPVAHPQRTSPVAALAIDIRGQGVTEEQVMDFLVAMGAVPETVDTLDKLETETLEVFHMLKEQLVDICGRIKEENGK